MEHVKIPLFLTNVKQIHLIFSNVKIELYLYQMHNWVFGEYHDINEYSIMVVIVAFEENKRYI